MSMSRCFKVVKKGGSDLPRTSRKSRGRWLHALLREEAEEEEKGKRGEVVTGEGVSYWMGVWERKLGVELQLLLVLK